MKNFKTILEQYQHINRKPCTNHLDKIFLKKFDQAYNMLSDKWKEIIRRTHLNCINKYWWKDHYSKSTYYRLKGKSESTFVEYYYKL